MGVCPGRRSGRCEEDIGGFQGLEEISNMVEAKWCKRKVAAYQHPPPDIFKATPQQMESFAEFKSWQDAISEPLFGNRSWVLALRDMAGANAEKEERAAQRISMMEWVTWMREGPGQGSRRQHRFTRNVFGTRGMS